MGEIKTKKPWNHFPGVGYLVTCPVHVCVSKLCAGGKGQSTALPTLPAQLLGQDFASSRLWETDLFQAFWHQSLEAALQEGSRVGTFPHLHGMIPSAGSLVWEDSQQSHPQPSGPACPVFLVTPPCTFFGKPWMIKEVRDFPHRMESRTSEKRSNNFKLHSRSALLSQCPWLLESQRCQVGVGL